MILLLNMALRVSVWSRICTPIAFRSCTGIAISEDFDFGILNCMENISQSRWYLLQLPAVYSKSRSKEDSSINKHISWYHQSVTNSPVTPLAPKIIVYQLPRRSQRASGRRVALGLQEWFLSGDTPRWPLEKYGKMMMIKLLGWLGQGTPGRSRDIPGNATAPLWGVVQCLNPLPERYQKNIQNPFAASRPLLSDFCIFLGT